MSKNEFKGKTRIRRQRTSRMPAVKKKADRQAIVERVLDFFERDEQARTEQKQDRLQRYAKFRMITPGSNYPWPDSSDTTMPDMMTQSLRVQDTLHNAVMSSESPVAAHALDDKGRDTADNVNKLITHQVFVDMDGETLIGDLAESFTNDGIGTIMTPWVREKIDSTRIEVFEELIEGVRPKDQFRALLTVKFPNAKLDSTPEGWDWIVTQDEDIIKVSFFTLESDRIEMVIKTPIIAFDGPLPMVYNWENVLHPPRAANLNFPSPSNPKGAAHVILKDNPTKDQIMSLIEEGFYDLPTKSDKDRFDGSVRTGKDEDMEVQKDRIAGDNDDRERSTEADSHRTLTLLTCFDGFDIDGDGIDEQVVWWVCKETQVLLKASLVEEIWPFKTPRRPFSEAVFLPVEGRRQGIGLLEMVEGFYEAKKILVDQAIDNNALTNLPFFFYRPSGSTRPEVVTLAPGEGYPLADPQRDVHFPSLSNNNVANTINLLRQLTAEEEKLTLTGDIQFGRVPPGGSSALRTVGGMELLQNQGEARPERVLRRFFLCLKSMYQNIHELNLVYLPPKKRIVIIRPKNENEDPYAVIDTLDDIAGIHDFRFAANVFNASRVALQRSLGTLMEVYLNPVAIQTGIIDAGGIYKLLRDFGKSQGQDPDQYLKAPSPSAILPKIFAEEVLATILTGRVPNAAPIEGAQAHFQKLQQFIDSDELFGQLTEAQVGLLGEYMNRLRALVGEEIRQQQLIQAAAQVQPGGNGVGRPAEQVPDTAQQPTLQENKIEGGNAQ